MSSRSVVYNFIANVGPFRAQLGAAGASVAAFGTRLNALDAQGARMRAGLSTVGGAAGKMGLVAAAGIGLAVKAAMDWESAWAGVTKTVNATATTSLPKLEGQLRALARELPASHEEIAGVAEAAGQLGIEADNVASFTRTMIDLGNTTNLSANDAATSIARFINVMGTAPTEVANVGAAVVDLGNNFATTEAEIMVLAQRLSAAGAIAGFTEGDVLGIATALSSVGVQAEAGGTAMSKVFIAMRDATLDGGAKLETFAETAGMSAKEFSDQWGADPVQALDAFIQGLGKMNEAGQSTTGVFKALSLTDQRLMRALLSTAEAQGILTRATETGNKAYEESTALAIEAAKRYDTSASRIKSSWGTVKDSMIDFGNAALPAIASAAEKVAGFAQALGSLPQPAKTAMTSLAGIAAVTGGGLWMASSAINGVANMRTALTNLGVSATGASKALKGVGIAAAVLGGAAIIDSLQKQSDEALPGMQALTEQLIKLSEVKGAAELSAEFDSLGDSLSRLVDKNWAQSLQDSIYDKNLWPGSDSRVDEAKAEIGLLDEALTNLVANGAAGTASEALKQIGENAGFNADQMKALTGLLPGYKEALTAQSNEAKLAAEANGELAGSADTAAASQKMAAQAAAESAKALAQNRESAHKTAASFISMGESLNDSSVSLGDWIGELEKQAEALRNFRINAEEAADKGLRKGIVEALREAGPEGALRLGQLADASEAEIARANKAWARGRAEIRRYTDEVGGVPAEKTTEFKVVKAGAEKAISAVEKALDFLGNKKTEPKISADNKPGMTAAQSMLAKLKDVDSTKTDPKVTAITDQAKAELARIQSMLGGINNKTVTVTTYHRTVMGPSALGPGGPRMTRAEGGPVYGPGTKTSDSIPAMLSNGEFVVKAAAVDYYGIDNLFRLNAMKLAEGGSASGVKARASAAKAFDLTGDLGVAGVRQEMREFERVMRKAGISTGKHFDKLGARAEKLTTRWLQVDRSLDALRSRRDDVRSSAAGSFSNDLFGNGLAGVMTQLEADRNDSSTMTKLLGQLRSKGLNGRGYEALASSGDINTAQQLLAAGKGGVAQYERLYAQRAAAQSGLGNAASTYLTKEIGTLTASQARMTKAIEGLEKRIERGVQRGAKAGIEGKDRMQSQTVRQRSRGGR